MLLSYRHQILHQIRTSHVVKSLIPCENVSVTLQRHRHVYVYPAVTDFYKKILSRDLSLYPEFITEEEEHALFAEFEKDLTRRRYESNHWDDVILNYRETARSTWNEQNAVVINRVRERAFPPNAMILPAVHIVDLAENGWIKSHVDSVRFCGTIIAGLSLLSNSVLRLSLEANKEMRCDVLLERRSLYVMKDEVRFDFAHEILKDEESLFDGVRVPRGRRISLVTRNEPTQSSTK